MSRGYEQRMYVVDVLYVHELKIKRKIGVLCTIYFSHVVQLYIQGEGEHPERVGHDDIPGML